MTTAPQEGPTGDLGLQTAKPPTLVAFVPGNYVPLAVTQIIMGTLILSSNCFASVVIIRSNLQQSRPSAFVIHLIACDVYRGVIALVTGILTLITGAMVYDTCRVIGFFGLSSVTLGSFAVPLLLYDRLIFISSPVNYTHRMSKKLIGFLVIFNFLQGVLLAVIPVNGWGTYEFSGILATCTIHWMDPAGFPALLIIWVHFIPLLLSALCFMRIVFWMRKRICQVRINTQVKVNWNMMQDQTFKEASLPMQLIGKTLFLVLAAYYFSWFPYFFFVIILVAGVDMGSHMDGLYTFLATLTLLTCLINPWLYWLPSRRFRRIALGLLPCSAQSVYAETEISSLPQPRTRSESLFVLNNYPIGATSMTASSSC